MIAENSIFFAAVEEQLREGRRVKLTLKGISMLTSLREGDTLTLAPVAEAPKVGDVVLFRCEGKHLLHRVVAVDGDRYILQGDNCYSKETASREDVLAVLVEVERLGGTDGKAWQCASRRALRRKRRKNWVARWLGRRGRKQLRPWYFAGLAFLMWAPLNGLGIPLDNYILGLRADHLLHASVFLPCTLFLMDLFGKKGSGGAHGWKWAVWLTAVAIGLLTEGGQWLLPYRGFDVNDLVANFLGVSLGWAVILLVKQRKRTNIKQ